MYGDAVLSSPRLLLLPLGAARLPAPAPGTHTNASIILIGTSAVRQYRLGKK